MNYPGAYSGQAPNAPYQGAPQQYGAAPPQQYGAAPPQQYGAAPPQQYGAAPPQQYGAAPPQQYGAAPPQQYGGAAPQQHGAAPGYPQQPCGVSPEVMSWFRAVDQDNSGYINATELSKALQSGNNRNFSVQACATMIVLQQQGYNVSPATVQLMVGKYGLSGGSTPHQVGGSAGLGLDGFILVNVQLRRLTDAFRQKDTQQKGQITIGYEEFITMVVNTV
ncbi:EF-hand domain pair [Trinorchestia longiramus]|nr:EF-hand domain pair [Trinorchestia longiramus]